VRSIKNGNKNGREKARRKMMYPTAQPSSGFLITKENAA